MNGSENNTTPLFMRVFIIFFLFIKTLFAANSQDPCNLLAMINRPSNADSACVVPAKHLLIESGYQWQELLPAGQSQNYPQLELRLGLLQNNELVLDLPNAIRQSVPPFSGYNPSTLGIKHEFGYTQHWLASAEALFTVPSGGGATGLGVAVNGIITYTFNTSMSISLMLGGSTQTQSSSLGGQRFSSINPDIVFSYVLTPALEAYGECYGQSKTGYQQPRGINADAGIIYLLASNITLDIEYGHRINGVLDNFEHYFGVGATFLL